MSWFEIALKESPYIKDYIDIKLWEYVGCTGTQFKYGFYSNYFIRGDNGQFYWFKFLGDNKKLYKDYRNYDNYIGYVCNIMQTCLWESICRNGKYHNV